MTQQISCFHLRLLIAFSLPSLALPACSSVVTCAASATATSVKGLN